MDVVVGGGGVVEGVVGEGFRFCFWMDWTLCGGVFFFSFSFFSQLLFLALWGKREGMCSFSKGINKKNSKLWLRILALRDKAWCTVSEFLSNFYICQS